ncbi:MAG: hypothetical protein Q4Q20_00015 [Methanocorpusculum sp.]|nr:hypothetical protein [Methanocorpusculum sp.]
MSATFSGEEILCKANRKGSYFIRYIPFLIIFAALAAAPWVLPRFIPKAAEILARIQTYIPNPTVIKVSICAVFGIIFIIVLIAAIRNLNIPRLLITEKRVALFKGNKKCREARIDKIDSFKVSGNTLSVYAGGRRVFSFGPVDSVWSIRDTIVLLIEGEYKGEDAYPHQGKPTDTAEPESISKSGDVLDAY